MKILKEFEDQEYWKHQFPRELHGSWFWGLGDDGRVYCQWNDPHSNTRLKDWHAIESIIKRNDIYIPIFHMKKIVKEFGNLLVFL